MGKNRRFLQGEDRDQPEIKQIRKALRNHTPVTVTLRNYRRDGTLFCNQFAIWPLFDSNGELIYFLGIQYDVKQKIKTQEGLNRLNALLEAIGEDPGGNS